MTTFWQLGHHFELVRGWSFDFVETARPLDRRVLHHISQVQFFVWTAYDMKEVGKGAMKMDGTLALSLWIALGAGALSFLSPCTLPLFPSYIGYISGLSQSPVADKQHNASVRVKILIHAVLFCAGLSTLFLLIGFGATAFGQVLTEFKSTVRVIGGVFILCMGIFMTGKVRVSVLMQEHRYRLPAKKPLGYFGSILVGVAFAAGWTPCIGPILSSVIMLTVAHPDVGIWYMAAYALGFCLPFLALAASLVSLRPILKYTNAMARIGGWILIVMGILLLTNKMTFITILLQKYTHYTGV